MTSCNSTKWPFWRDFQRFRSLSESRLVPIIMPARTTKKCAETGPTAIDQSQSPSPLFYIGALGSRRTHEKRLERLRAAGLGDLTGRIHSPIGLDLGGRSPAEIAVSILAEVIQVRYRGERA